MWADAAAIWHGIIPDWKGWLRSGVPGASLSGFSAMLSREAGSWESANSDEYRGRCGGGVPGTAVFGTRGGLTGILAPSLNRATIAKTLRARHTFATTGPRLVAMLSTKDGHVQGDEIELAASESLFLDYAFYGNEGFSTIEAFDASGCIWRRDLWQEAQTPPKVLRVSWGGARLYDRYREAFWDALIQLSQDASLKSFQALGGFMYNPEDEVKQVDFRSLSFSSRTSGDVDGVHICFEGELPQSVSVTGKLGGYVKVGDPLAGHPHKPQPTFSLEANLEEIKAPGGKKIDIYGGADLFVSVEAIPEEPLPKDVNGMVDLQGVPGEENAVYFIGREWSGDKVITSPLFVKFV